MTPPPQKWKLCSAELLNFIFETVIYPYLKLLRSNEKVHTVQMRKWYKWVWSIANWFPCLLICLFILFFMFPDAYVCACACTWVEHRYWINLNRKRLNHIINDGNNDFICIWCKSNLISVFSFRLFSDLCDIITLIVQVFFLFSQILWPQ